MHSQRRFRLVFLAHLTMFSLLFSTEGTATSWVKIPPHKPSEACEAIEAAVAEMTGKKPQSSLWPLYYSDDFGHVESGERPAFIRSMTTAEGRRDNAPIQITMVWPVGKRKASDAKALYVVGLERDKWYPEREGSFDPMQTEPAGYQIDNSYWLVAFSADRIIEVREGRYYFDLLEYDKRLKGCGRG
ncbi:MAG: hypothetical protein ABIO43_10310 [Sphingomicrobium sp.]